MDITQFPFVVRMHIDDAMRDLISNPCNRCADVKVGMRDIVRIQKVQKEHKLDYLITFIPPSGNAQYVELNRDFTCHYDTICNFMSLEDFTIHQSIKAAVIRD